MPRILHVLNATTGGAAVSLLEFLRATIENSSDMEHFVVYAGPPGPPDPAFAAVSAGCRTAPLRTWNSHFRLAPLRRFVGKTLELKNTQWGLRSQRELLRAIREWSIDLVTTNCVTNIDGALAARQEGVPHVWHIRERAGSGGSIRFRMSDRKVAQRVHSLSSGIAAVSRYAAEPFCSEHRASRVAVVYDGVDPRPFVDRLVHSQSRELRRKWGVRDDQVLVGKVANVVWEVKRHELFLRAASLIARSHRDVKFVVIGSLPESDGWMRRGTQRYHRRLQRLALECGLEDRLVWAGALDEPAVFMTALDVVAHASEIEAFPRVVLEAMAAARPVVGPAAGGVAEGVQDGVTGILVSPQSPEALAKGIEALLVDPDRCRTLGVGGRQRVIERYSIHQHAETMRNLYLTHLRPMVGSRASG